MKSNLFRKAVLSLIPILLFCAFSVPAKSPLPTLVPYSYVHDFADVITQEKESVIQTAAENLKDKFQTEVAVVTINSLQGADVFDYSMQIARAWGIGSKEGNTRGLLILVAVEDRKIALRTSRHLEGDLIDSATGEISRQMNTVFKEGDFGAGLLLGLQLISEKLSSNVQSNPLEI